MRTMKEQLARLIETRATAIVVTVLVVSLGLYICARRMLSLPYQHDMHFNMSNGPGSPARVVLVDFNWIYVGSIPIPDFVIIVILPVFLVLFYRLRMTILRKHRIESGCCAHCGYDMRANRTKCSECGAGVPDQGKANDVHSP